MVRSSRLRDRHKTCNCSILILGLLRFGISHQYIYIHITYFSFCEILNSEQYRVIVIYSPTPGRQVSARSFRY